MEIFVLVLQVALAAVLAVAAVGKFMDLPGSRKAVREFGVPRKYADSSGTALPFGELLLAALLLFGSTARLGALGAFLLLLAFIGGIGWNLRHGRTPDCHCFGELHSSPAGWHTIIRNSVFALMALIVVIAGGVGPVETIEELSPAGRVGLWVTVLVVGLGFVLARLLDRIAKQQAHLRADIEALQTASLFAALESTSMADPAATPVLPAAPPEDPVGEPAPSLDLPTLDGGRLTLEGIRGAGKPALLLFTSPTCSFCSAMYPEVEEWSRRFGGDLTVAVIGRGEIEANREKLGGYDFEFAAIDEDGDTAAAFDAVATPTGVIVMPTGRIVDEVARGRPEIQKLVGRILKHRQMQRAAAAPAPAPAAAGPTSTLTEAATTASQIDVWPAPSFEVATTDGGTMSLDSLLARGKPVLVVFWSPTCGYCERFAPELGEWHRRFGDDVTIAIISDIGDQGIHEQIAAFGFEHVGLQERRSVMAQFSGTGTPSGILIQPDGWVEGGVATGAPMIRQLLGKVVNRGERRQARTSLSPVPTPNGSTTSASEDAETQKEDAIRKSLLASLKGPELGTEGSRLPWQTLHGDFVGLDEYRGREVTLVFWGVDCEFSQRMLPELKEWEDEAGDAIAGVIIISSGDVEANLAQGLRSRVVLDDTFSTGNQYGVTGTPAAVRLDRDGRIASKLAVGSDAVLDLLYEMIDAPDPALN